MGQLLCCTPVLAVPGCWLCLVEGPGVILDDVVWFGACCGLGPNSFSVAVGWVVQTAGPGARLSSP